MSKISVEMRCGTARFAVAVQASTIQQALHIAATRYPANVVRVKLPTVQVGSAVGDRAA